MNEPKVAAVPAASPASKPPLVSGGRVAAIVPADFESAYRLATVVVRSGMSPKSLDTIEKATVAILHGLELGLTPMAALQSIAVVNGMPTVYGDGLLALVRGSGLLEDIQETCESDDQGPTIAVCKVKRAGQQSWTVQTFTRPQAMRAGLWKKAGPWTQYPSRMMQMRARSWALRDAFADVLRGISSAEEAADMVDVTARGNVSWSRPPEPTRADFSEPAADDGATVESTDDTAGSVEANAETGEVYTRRQWKIGDNVVGQDERYKAMLDLLEVCSFPQDCDDLAADWQEFTEKLGRRKAEALAAIRNRKAILEGAPTTGGK